MAHTHFDEYLKTFFEIELYFFSSPELQLKAWRGVKGEEFAMTLLVYFESWSVIVNNRDKFKLSNSLFTEIKKLFEMIEAFQADRTIAYNSSILGNYEWRQIQKKAQQLCSKNPMIN